VIPQKGGQFQPGGQSVPIAGARGGHCADRGGPAQAPTGAEPIEGSADEAGGETVSGSDGVDNL
jgi:hypothetical protein